MGVAHMRNRQIYKQSMMLHTFTISIKETLDARISVTVICFTIHILHTRHHLGLIEQQARVHCAEGFHRVTKDRCDVHRDGRVLHVHQLQVVQVTGSFVVGRRLNLNLYSFSALPLSKAFLYNIGLDKTIS